MSRSTFVLASIFAAVLALPPARAGDVTVTVTAGSLNLSGGGSDDTVVVDQDLLAANEFRVSPGAFTTVNGSMLALTFQNVTKDIVVALGDGTNSCTIYESLVKRDVVGHGPSLGTLFLNVSDSSVRDDVLVDTLGGAVGVSLVNGLVRDDVKVVGGTNGDACSLINAVVLGEVVFTGNAGGDNLLLNGTRIRGKVSGSGGPNNDGFSVLASTCEGDVKWSADDDDDTTTFTYAEVAGNLKIDSGAGMDVTILQGGRVDGGVALLLGAGSNSVQLSLLQIAEGLRIDGGPNDDSISAFDTCAVGEDVRVKLGDGTNECGLEDFAVDGDIRVEGGAGRDTIEVNESAIRGDLRVESGATQVGFFDQVTAADDQIRGSVKLTSSSDMDPNVLRSAVRGNVSFAVGGATNAKLRTSSARQFKLVVGAGVDFVTLDQGTSVQKDVVIDAGDGNNQITFDGLNVGDDLKLTTGSGNDMLTFGAVVVVGQTTLDSGSGTDTGF